MALKPQNTTHAVMAQRFEAIDSPDDFPTPPWATRALFEFVLGSREGLKGLTCLEPACGAGHMAKVLDEYFDHVVSKDAFYYGYGGIQNFLDAHFEAEQYDWIITNPPFRLAEDFVLRSLELSRRGVAILARTVFIESVGRYNKLFSKDPPTFFVQFCERVPMVKGRLDAKASTATGYCWLVWDKKIVGGPQLRWIPQCRKRLERPRDYEAAPKPATHEKNKQILPQDSQMRLAL